MEVHHAVPERMQLDEQRSERSSSDISSPPISPPAKNGFSDTIHVAKPQSAKFELGGGVSDPRQLPANSANASTSTTANASALASNASSSVDAPAPEKPKRQRKTKAVDPDKPVPEKKPRKPRATPAATANGASTSAPRKRQKTTNIPQDAAAPAPSRQPTITEMVGTFQTPPVPPTSVPIPRPQSEMMMRNSLPPPSGPPTPRPISSGQNYDPIRSATIEPGATRAPNGTHSAISSPHVNRASASPSIASLIDPPVITKTSAPSPMSNSPQTAVHQPFVTSYPQPILPSQPGMTVQQPAAPQLSPPAASAKATFSTLDGAMDIDLKCEAPPLPTDKESAEMKVQSKASSSTATPKAPRPTPPPRPTGSGLLSSSDLFGGPSANEDSARKGVTIDIQIRLDPKGGNTINIAQEITKKYGRDAINPRAAAHREQLLQIAAAANKIDGGSADDMSVDLMSELDGDSNVEMGGMDDDKSAVGENGDKPKRRTRTKKAEEYDKEDDFIDDTELAWQEQAAVAKDGFFVYSGPLIPEGEKASVETSAPTRGTRGRGRARGRGAAANGTTHATLANKTAETGTRGRGRGRGTGQPRKPRITKADRERMDMEKMQRERTAQTMGGGPSTGPPPLAMAPAAGQGPSMGAGTTT